VPVSYVYKCLFIHIPKSGGTSIERALGIFGDWKVEDRKNLFGLIQTKELLEKNFLSNFLQHLTFSDIHSFHSDSVGFFSFAFVRNPWDKLVSVYSNPDNNLINELKKDGFELEKSSFTQFIHHLEYINHIHLEKQYKFVTDSKGDIIVDFIGRFENFEADFCKIVNITGCNGKLEHYNASFHDKYRDYYTKDTRRIVQEIYSEDIDYFGYKF
jgi:hypothetical protein